MTSPAVVLVVIRHRALVGRPDRDFAYPHRVPYGVLEKARQLYRRLARVMTGPKSMTRLKIRHVKAYGLYGLDSLIVGSRLQ